MNGKQTVPAPLKLNLLRQICDLIPEFLVAKIARETKVDEKARTSGLGVMSSAWSTQLTHSIGFNDVYAALCLYSRSLAFSRRRQAGRHRRALIEKIAATRRGSR